MDAADPSAPPRRPTIDDVASEAGVSVATVSRALRGLPNVALSTRARVEAVANRLHYRPDPHASRLAAGRTRTISMVVPIVNTWYFSEVLAAGEAVLADAGYDVMISSVSTPTRRAAFIIEASRLRRTDGLILVDLVLEQEEIETLRQADVPVVTTGYRTGVFPAVTVDNVAVGRTAVDHLVALGHSRIGLVTGQATDPLHFSVPDARRDGYTAAMIAHGLDPAPELQRAGNFSIAGGREAINALLDLDDPPTAVFAMSDEMAFGAIEQARERGRRVPEDLGVVGVDDHEMSELLGVTTVRQDVDRHGATAARLLLERLEDVESPPLDEELPTELVVRGSTAPR